MRGGKVGTKGGGWDGQGRQVKKQEDKENRGE